MSSVPPVGSAPPAPQSYQSGDMNSFKDSLKSMSTSDLANMLTNPALSPAQKDAVKAELVGRSQGANQSDQSGGSGGSSGANGAGGSNGAGGNSSSRLDDLLSKLLAGDQLSGTEEDELKKLLKALGMSDAQIDQFMKQGKGAGSTTGGDAGPSSAGDIQGG